MNRYSKTNAILFIVTIILAIVSVSASYGLASFQDTPHTPPNQNASGPINVSPDPQTKQGPLQSNTQFRAPRFESLTNPDFHLTPDGMSTVQHISAENVYIRAINRWVSDLTGRPTRFWRSGTYGYPHNAGGGGQTANLVDRNSFQYCALTQILHDGGNGAWCNVYPSGNMWQINFGKWGNGGISCSVTCIGW